LRLIGLHIDVDVLQLADLLAVTIDEHLAVPISHVLRGSLLLLSR
jgi:hypothetical protein